MEIQREDNGKKGAFFIEDEGNRVAEMTYLFAGDKKFIIDHTEIADTLRGKGIGVQLVDEAVQYARNNQFKILPLCPFAKSVFKKRSEYGDILF